jgi:hypothetical protein
MKLKNPKRYLICWLAYLVLVVAAYWVRQDPRLFGQDAISFDQLRILMRDRAFVQEVDSVRLPSSSFFTQVVKHNGKSMFVLTPFQSELTEETKLFHDSGISVAAVDDWVPGYSFLFLLVIGLFGTLHALSLVYEDHIRRKEK